MKVRRYKKGEEEELWMLLYDTVHKVNGRDYSQKQIEAWASDQINLAEWKQRLETTNPFVVDNENQLLGFAEFEENGHIDCFYVHHKWHNKGVGSGVTILAIAFAFHGLVAATGTLVIAMLVHAVYDLWVGFSIRRQSLAWDLEAGVS